MFHDFKQAVEEMISNSQEYVDGFISLDKDVWDRFIQEYNVCFVEPEDDEEYQDYSSPWERGEL